MLWVSLSALYHVLLFQISHSNLKLFSHGWNFFFLSSSVFFSSMFLFLSLVLFSLRTSSNSLSIFLNVFSSGYLRLNSYIENTLSSVPLMGVFVFLWWYQRYGFRSHEMHYCPFSFLFIERWIFLLKKCKVWWDFLVLKILICLFYENWFLWFFDINHGLFLT